MPFQSELAVRENRDSGDDRWVLLSDLSYKGNRDRFMVSEGFMTDFASTPRALWSLFPPTGKHTRAAVLHDAFYQGRAYGSIVEDGQHVGWEPTFVTRKDADGIFLRTMKEAGVSWWKRYSMWSAVRTFGWIHYKGGPR